jgi:hypothetical protein
VDPADAIKTYHLAMLVGEETAVGRTASAGPTSFGYRSRGSPSRRRRGVVPDIAAGPSELAASTLSIQARNCSKL